MDSVPVGSAYVKSFSMIPFYKLRNASNNIPHSITIAG